MKTKLYLIAMLSLISLNLFAQKDFSKFEIEKNIPSFIEIDKCMAGNAYFNLKSNGWILYSNEIEQDWVNNAWLNQERTVTLVDTIAKTITFFSSQWDSSSASWIEASKNIMTFDYNNSNSTFWFVKVEMFIYQNGSYELMFQSNYVYDSNNFLIEVTTKADFGAGMMDYQKINYTNNSVGLPLVGISQIISFSTFQLVNNEKITYTYNPSNSKDLVTELEAKWNGTTWIDTSKVEYTRNSMLNVLTEIFSDIYGGSTVVPTNKEEYTYLSGDELVSVNTEYSWNQIGSNWTQHSRVVYTYTSFNEPETRTLENYINNGWVIWFKTTYAYDGQQREIEELTQEYISNAFVNSNRDITSYDPTGVDDELNQPAKFTLNQNYPNPFNPSTIIGFTLQTSGFVSLKIFNVLGNEVATLINNSWKTAGEHSREFNAGEFALQSGVYFYQLQIGSTLATKKLVLMK